jgi:hypothetical protein
MVDPTGTYRSNRGTIWRVLESAEGTLSVQLLDDGRWIPGPIGMIGLRLVATTTRLGKKAVLALPE